MNKEKNKEQPNNREFIKAGRFDRIKRKVMESVVENNRKKQVRLQIDKEFLYLGLFGKDEE